MNPKRGNCFLIWPTSYLLWFPKSEFWAYNLKQALSRNTLGASTEYKCLETNNILWTTSFTVSRVHLYPTPCFQVTNETRRESKKRFLIPVSLEGLGSSTIDNQSFKSVRLSALEVQSIVEENIRHLLEPGSLCNLHSYAT